MSLNVPFIGIYFFFALTIVIFLWVMKQVWDNHIVCSSRVLCDQTSHNDDTSIVGSCLMSKHRDVFPDVGTFDLTYFVPVLF